MMNRSVQVANGMPKIPTLSLSQTQIHISLPLPENAFIIIILPAATGSSQYSSKVVLVLLIRYCRSVRHEMLTSITYGYEKGSTSGNEKYFDFFSSFCPVLVLFPFFLSLSYRSGSAYALELGGAW